MLEGKIQPVPQDGSKATYAGKITKGMGEVDWSGEAAAVDRHVRAMTPWPSAYTFVDGRRLILERVRPAEGDFGDEPAGKVVSLDPLVVSCGVGHVEVLRVKPEGKKSMAPGAYLAGRPLRAGSILG